MAEIISKEYLTRQFYKFKNDYLEKTTGSKQNKIEFDPELFDYTAADTTISEDGSSQVGSNDLLSLNFSGNNTGNLNDYLLSYRTSNGKFKFKWQTPANSQKAENSDSFLINLKCLKDYTGTSNIDTVGTIISGTWSGIIITDKQTSITGTNYSIIGNGTDLKINQTTLNTGLTINDTGLTVNSGDTVFKADGAAITLAGGETDFIISDNGITISTGDVTLKANKNTFSIGNAIFSSDGLSIEGLNVTENSIALKASTISIGEQSDVYEINGYSILTYKNGALKFNDDQSFIMSNEYNATNDDYFKAYKS